MDVVNSKNNVPIRLTNERWLHIGEEHNELAGYYFDVLETISDAEEIYKGKKSECIAIKALEGKKKYLVVVYKETSKDDGFVITAFFTKRIESLRRRKRLWP